MSYEKIDINFIINWCKENNQVSWLKATASQQTDYKVYPRIKVKDENGKTKWKADKTQAPTIEKRPISFIQLKKEFVYKFMPELAPKAKEKAPTMYELIANL